MVKVEINGQVVEFAQMPTEADIDEAASQLQQTPAPPARTAGVFPGLPTSSPSAKKSIPALAADAAAAQETARRANSGLGIFVNTLREVGNTLTSSEQALGNTIGNIAATGRNADMLSQSAIANADLAKKVLETIRQKRARGEDTTRLEEAFNKYGARVADTSSLPELPTTAQAVGQIGGVALDTLTAGTYGKAAAGLQTGELAPNLAKLPLAAQALRQQSGEAAGLFTAKGAGRVATGAGIGYGYDITQGLQGNRGEDRTGMNALIPGANTALGAALPAISGATQSVKGLTGQGRADRISANNEKTLRQVVQDNTPLRNTVAKQSKQGVDAVKILSQTDLLHNSVDKTGTINTTRAIADLNDFIKPQEDVISKILAKENAKVELSSVQKQLENAVNNSGLEGEALDNAYSKVQREISGLARRADSNGMITVSKIHDAKVNKYATLDYTNEGSKIADKAIAKTYKLIVENNTKSADVKALNKELSQYFAVLSLLEKLNGKKVEGGRLGKYFARAFGAAVGSHFGPLGAAVGSEVAGAAKGMSLSSKLYGKTGQKLSQSALMRSALEDVSKPRLMLPPGTGKGPTAGSGYTIHLPQSGETNLRTTFPDQSAVNMRQTMKPMAAIQQIANTIPPTIPQKETYMQQGLRELGDIGKAMKDQHGFVRIPGKSIKPADLAARMSPEDIRLANEYILKLKDSNPNVYIGIRTKIQPMLKAMGIDKLPEAEQEALLRGAAQIIGPDQWNAAVKSPMSQKFDAAPSRTIPSDPLAKVRTTLRDEATGKLKGSSWRTTASKPSKAANTSTGNVPIDKTAGSKPSAAMSGGTKGGKLPAVNVKDTLKDPALAEQITNAITSSGSWTGKSATGEDVFGGPVTKGKRIDIVIGPPAAGKSELFANPLSKKNGAILIDADRVKAMMPGFNGRNAAEYHGASSDLVEGPLMRKALSDGSNIVLPIVGKTPATIETLAKLAKSYGYDVNLTLNNVPPEVAAARAATRAANTGRVVPENYILNEVGNKPSLNFDRLKKRTDLFDSYQGFDSNVEKGAGIDLTSASTRTYSFVSPNTKVGLSYADAQEALHTPEHTAALKNALAVDRSVDIPAATHSAIGKWTDGAEDTFYYKDGDIPTTDLIYATAKKAIGTGAPETAQKQFIYFKEGEGIDRVHEVHFTKVTPKEISDAASKLGIDYQTIADDRLIVFNKSGDYFDPTMMTKIFKLKQQFPDNITSIETVRGTGDFVGSWKSGDMEARQEAVDIYNGIIQSYEKNR